MPLWGWGGCEIAELGDKQAEPDALTHCSGRGRKSDFGSQQKFHRDMNFWGKSYQIVYNSRAPRKRPKTLALAKIQKLHHQNQFPELIKPVHFIFPHDPISWRYLQFCMAFCQGISYWLETLQADQAERLFCLACLRIWNFSRKFQILRQARQNNLSAWPAWRVSSQ